MGQRMNRIESLLEKSFSPKHLEVIDESNQHSGPQTETHFRVRIVSSTFESKSLVERHRLVYQALQPELDSGLHALAIETFAESENFKSRESPPCAHKS